MDMGCAVCVPVIFFARSYRCTVLPSKFVVENAKGDAIFTINGPAWFSQGICFPGDVEFPVTGSSFCCWLLRGRWCRTADAKGSDAPSPLRVVVDVEKRNMKPSVSINWLAYREWYPNRKISHPKFHFVKISRGNQLTHV